ncbi:hypothetical protein T439DRAFT_329721 [Meredithblackwellia eburnea MCA 4105]
MSSLLDLDALSLEEAQAIQQQNKAKINGGEHSGPSIPTAQRARQIHGVHTEVLVQSFADRVFVVVTQLGRIGSLIQVNPPPPSIPAPLQSTSSSLFPSLPPPHPATTMTPVLGVAPSPHVRMLHELYAAQIGAIVFKGSGPDAQGGGTGREGRPVLIGIALKSAGRSVEAGSGADDGSDGEGAGVSDDERELFGAVMEMVASCSHVW